MAAKDRDQDYVIDLCDEVLQERALREHRFEWLLGDVGKNGKARRLPVDAYYPKHELVVEYRERQHVKPMPHFDKTHVITVSGVHRGEQRKLYDLRRETEIPRQRLRLVIIPCDSLDVNAAGRLRRNRDADLPVIRTLLSR
jgi:hypothetical protein